MSGGRPRSGVPESGAGHEQVQIEGAPSPLPYPRPALEIDECIPFTYGQIRQFAAEMKKRGIKPELELYHPGCAWVVDVSDRARPDRKTLLDANRDGLPDRQFPTVENVLQILKEVPKDALWLCSAIGPFQLPLTTLAILMGGHVRVGLEDNVYYSRGRKAKSNAELVQRTVRIAHELNRAVATPAQAAHGCRVAEQYSSCNTIGFRLCEPLAACTFACAL